MVFVPRPRWPRRAMAATMSPTAREVLNELRWREPSRLADARVFYRDRTRPEGYRVIRGSEIVELEVAISPRAPPGSHTTRSRRLSARARRCSSNEVCDAFHRHRGLRDLADLPLRRCIWPKGCAARKRSVNWTASGGLVASGPGEVRRR